MSPIRYLVVNLILLSFWLILLASSFGCALPDQQHTVRLISPKPSTSQPASRSVRFENCVIRLNQEGLKQDLIEQLCVQAHGRIEFIKPTTQE